MKLGYSGSDCRQIKTGMIDPNLLYLVRGRGGDPDFIINRGLPGAGGIAPQAAELGAALLQELRPSYNPPSISAITLRESHP